MIYFDDICMNYVHRHEIVFSHNCIIAPGNTLFRMILAFTNRVLHVNILHFGCLICFYITNSADMGIIVVFTSK